MSKSNESEPQFIMVSPAVTRIMENEASALGFENISDYTHFMLLLARVARPALENGMKVLVPTENENEYRPFGLPKGVVPKKQLHKMFNQKMNESFGADTRNNLMSVLGPRPDGKGSGPENGR